MGQQFGDPTYFGAPTMGALLEPLTDKAFKGIMLFDQNITEDPSNIIPNVSKMNQVGCAPDNANGSVYPYRGVLNTLETKPLENGYRYVWDFATDKANGTIRSVCLTSPVSGYSGADNGDEAFESPSNAGTRFRALRSGVSGEVTTNYNVKSDIAYNGKILCAPDAVYNYPIGSFEPYKYLWLKYDVNNPKSYSFLQRELDYTKVSLKQRYKQVDKTTVVTTTNAKLSRFPIADDDFIYSFAKTATDSFDFVKIDVKTLQIVEEKNIRIQDAVFIQNIVGLQGLVCDGYYYVCDGVNLDAVSYPHSFYGASKVYKINTEDLSDYQCIDLLAEGITDYKDIYVQLYKYNGMVLITQDYNGNRKVSSQCCVLNSANFKKFKCYTYYSSSSGQNGKEIIIPSPWLPKPFVLGVGLGSNGIKRGQSIRFGFDTCYMATINNLSTPVVKNETQTMKITYELTEV